MINLVMHLFVGIVLMSIWLLTHPIIDLASITFVMLALLWIVIRKARQSGLFIARRTDAEIYHRKCQGCDGCGVTMLDGTIIPESIRTFRNTRQGYVFNSKLANTKTCTFCQGLGRVWIENDIPRPISQNRRLNDKWQ